MDRLSWGNSDSDKGGQADLAPPTVDVAQQTARHAGQLGDGQVRRQTVGAGNDKGGVTETRPGFFGPALRRGPGNGPVRGRGGGDARGLGGGHVHARRPRGGPPATRRPWGDGPSGRAPDNGGCPSGKALSIGGWPSGGAPWSWPSWLSVGGRGGRCFLGHGVGTHFRGPASDQKERQEEIKASHETGIIKLLKRRRDGGSPRYIS
jgi:hypothetical protein